MVVAVAQADLPALRISSWRPAPYPDPCSSSANNEPATRYYEAYQAADAFGLQQAIGELGAFGAPLQAELDALKVKVDAALGAEAEALKAKVAATRVPSTIALAEVGGT